MIIRVSSIIDSSLSIKYFTNGCVDEKKSKQVDVQNEYPYEQITIL